MKFDNIGTYRKQKTNQQGGKKNEQKICQHAESRGFLHTHTHTHTHTDSFLKSLKQIGTICFAFSFLIFPNFASADNIPTTNPGCTTTVLGADNIANGSAALEPDFSANTINTTWYSNGTQLTGNNIPATCTYDDALTPPTPEDRPGYVFAGWRLMPPACLIPSSLASTDGLSFGYKNDSSSSGYDPIYRPYSENASDYGLTEDNTWGVSWSNGDKVVGEAKCSALQGNNHSRQWGGDSADWTATESELTNASDGTKYCWCRATGYIASGASQCSLLSPSWVFLGVYRTAPDCAELCASVCASHVKDIDDFRPALFTGLLAE